MKAITWLEKVAEFPEDRRATRGRAAWAIKDKLVEILSKGAPLTHERTGARRANCFGLADLSKPSSPQSYG